MGLHPSKCEGSELSQALSYQICNDISCTDSDTHHTCLGTNATLKSCPYGYTENPAEVDGIVQVESVTNCVATQRQCLLDKTSSRWRPDLATEVKCCDGELTGPAICQEAGCGPESKAFCEDVVYTEYCNDPNNIMGNDTCRQFCIDDPGDSVCRIALTNHCVDEKLFSPECYGWTHNEGGYTHTDEHIKMISDQKLEYCIGGNIDHSNDPECVEEFKNDEEAVLKWCKNFNEDIPFCQTFILNDCEDKTDLFLWNDCKDLCIDVPVNPVCTAALGERCVDNKLFSEECSGWSNSDKWDDTHMEEIRQQTMVYCNNPINKEQQECKDFFTDNVAFVQNYCLNNQDTDFCDTKTKEYCTNNMSETACKQYCNENPSVEPCKTHLESICKGEALFVDECDGFTSPENPDYDEVINKLFEYCKVSNNSIKPNCIDFLKTEAYNWCLDHPNDSSCSCLLPDQEAIKEEAIKQGVLENKLNCEDRNQCIDNIVIKSGNYESLTASTSPPCCVECGNKCGVKGCGGDCNCGTDESISVCVDNICKCPISCPVGMKCGTEGKCVACTPNCTGLCGGAIEPTCGTVCNTCPEDLDCVDKKCEEIGFFETDGGIAVIVTISIVGFCLIIFLLYKFVV